MTGTVARDRLLKVGLLGPGLIGRTFLSQLRDQSRSLEDEYGVDIRILAIANSKKMLLSDVGVDLDVWEEDFHSSQQELDYHKFATHLSETQTKAVIIDCTASDDPPKQYLDWMTRGINIITPNKKFCSGDGSRYLALKDSQRRSGYSTQFFYEGTVGAGLPIIQTLQNLVRTGDKIKKIEGIFSGTLSYIFNTFGTDSRTFSDIVIEAKDSGFTEPDPRDDLAGVDVARKVTILARECGLRLELEDVSVKSLVPESLQTCSTASEYIQRLPEFDIEMQSILEKASQAGECLRYVGVVDPTDNTGMVELRRYSKQHPFAHLSGSDNIIAFTTDRYSEQPLIVRGPGAGAEVTAGGVFSDLLRLLQI
jgi:aspartokinase/homoserine dehydrogenase 1